MSTVGYGVHAGRVRTDQVRRDGVARGGEAVDLDTWIGLRADPESAPDRLGWHWYGYNTAPYWLTVQDGSIVQIGEQYLP